MNEAVIPFFASGSALIVAGVALYRQGRPIDWMQAWLVIVLLAAGAFGFSGVAALLGI